MLGIKWGIWWESTCTVLTHSHSLWYTIMQSLVSIPAISGLSIGYDGFLSVSTVVFVWLFVLDSAKARFHLHVYQKSGGAKIKFFKCVGAMAPLAPPVRTPLNDTNNDLAWLTILNYIRRLSRQTSVNYISSWFRGYIWNMLSWFALINVIIGILFIIEIK